MGSRIPSSRVTKPSLPNGRSVLARSRRRKAADISVAGSVWSAGLHRRLHHIASRFQDQEGIFPSIGCRERLHSRVGETANRNRLARLWINPECVRSVSRRGDFPIDSGATCERCAGGSRHFQAPPPERSGFSNTSWRRKRNGLWCYTFPLRNSTNSFFLRRFFNIIAGITLATVRMPAIK